MTASPPAAKPRSGRTANRCRAGTELPAGKSFVFGKDIGDYSGVADATYHFQVTETGGFQLRDKSGAVQDAVGAPGTACAEGAGLVDADDAAPNFTFTRDGTPPALVDTTKTPPTSANRRAKRTESRAAKNARRRPSRPRSTRSRAAARPARWSARKVEITGVVVGVDNQVGVSNFTELDPRQEGIYVETPTAEQDTNTQTSEGIFVGGLPAEDRSAEHIGQTVTVSGIGRRALRPDDGRSDGPDADLHRHGEEEEPPRPGRDRPERGRSAERSPSNGTRPYYESLEGMRVELPVGTADSGGTSQVR